MASSTTPLLIALIFAIFSNLCLAARDLAPFSQAVLDYHRGPLLTGDISLNLIWYGDFKPSQRAIVLDFLHSLSAPANGIASVATWWKGTDRYYSTLNSAPLQLSVGRQMSDVRYSMGKKLRSDQIVELASKGANENAITVVLTASDVVVDGFCSIKCGSHGSGKSPSSKFAYIWVGNAELQCPGHCAWPFHKPIYGPQSPALIAPNNDVGMDGVLTNLATLMVGTVTNPYGNGYFQGTKEAPMEASSGCAGVYGKGAYPGYAGDLLVDSASGASYNAIGNNGRKYLLPAMMIPGTGTCSTLL